MLRAYLASNIPNWCVRIAPLRSPVEQTSDRTSTCHTPARTCAHPLVRCAIHPSVAPVEVLRSTYAYMCTSQGTASGRKDRQGHPALLLSLRRRDAGRRRRLRPARGRRGGAQSRDAAREPRDQLLELAREATGPHRRFRLFVRGAQGRRTVESIAPSPPRFSGTRPVPPSRTTPAAKTSTPLRSGATATNTAT